MYRKKEQSNSHTIALFDSDLTETNCCTNRVFVTKDRQDFIAKIQHIYEYVIKNKKTTLCVYDYNTNHQSLKFIIFEIARLFSHQAVEYCSTKFFNI